MRNRECYLSHSQHPPKILMPHATVMLVTQGQIWGRWASRWIRGVTELLLRKASPTSWMIPKIHLAISRQQALPHLICRRQSSRDRFAQWCLSQVKKPRLRLASTEKLINRRYSKIPGHKGHIRICLSPKMSTWGIHNPSHRSAIKDHPSGRLIVSKPFL